MYDNVGIFFYVMFMCWIDWYLEFFGVQFDRCFIIEKFVLENFDGRWFEFFYMVCVLMIELQVFVQVDLLFIKFFCKNCVIKYVMLIFFFYILFKVKILVEFDFFFGMKVF